MTRRPARSLASAVRAWRAPDKHTGIAKDRGVPYTYEHVTAAPHAGADVYRIETYIPFAPPTAIHRDVYYVPSHRLDDFFNGWEEHATTVVDIRPVTRAAALREIREFQGRAVSETREFHRRTPHPRECRPRRRQPSRSRSPR